MSCLSFFFDIISNVSCVIRGWGLKSTPGTCYKKFSGVKYSPGGRPLGMGTLGMADFGNGGPLPNGKHIMQISECSQRILI